MIDSFVENITKLSPDNLFGKPIIKDTRISVEFIIDFLSDKHTTEQVLKNYPQLRKENIMLLLNMRQKY
jgi:uncharacterized protein (DUF433 family)